jgi:hypothetical protein
MARKKPVGDCCRPMAEGKGHHAFTCPVWANKRALAVAKRNTKEGRK